MKRYVIEAEHHNGSTEVTVDYDNVTKQYVVNYNELFGTEGTYMVSTEGAVKEVLRDLAEGRAVEQCCEMYTDDGWVEVGKDYLVDFYTREIDKTEAECGWATFEDWYSDMLRSDLIREEVD